MNPRRIDGIYQRDIDRRYESQRRLVVHVEDDDLVIDSERTEVNGALHTRNA
jgi:hypothetical protein